jgi:hypothetical protein
LKICRNEGKAIVKLIDTTSPYSRTSIPLLNLSTSTVSPYNKEQSSRFNLENFSQPTFSQEDVSKSIIFIPRKSEFVKVTDSFMGGNWVDEEKGVFCKVKSYFRGKEDVKKQEYQIT